MYPIAHAYLMEQLFAERAPMLYLGCVWPDMLFKGPLTHHQTHHECLGLLTYARTHAPEIVSFVRAALTHGAEPHGFDWFSDEQYDRDSERGYAFTRAQPFVEPIVAAGHFDPAIGLWKAHNFVEMTFEQSLGNQFPHLGRAVLTACQDESLVRTMLTPVATYFGVEAESLVQNVLNFPQSVALETPTFDDLARSYAYQLDLKHDVKDADIPAMAAILAQVWDSIAADRDEFLATSVREVAHVLDL